jgi:HEAT repeat protein
MQRRLRFASALSLAVLAASSTSSAVAQDQPKPPPAEPGIPPAKPPKDAGKGNRIKMGGDTDPPPDQPKEGDKPAPKAPEKTEKTEPEMWMDALAQWPSAEAKQASIRLANEPTISYPMLEKKMYEANQDWRVICGVASTLGKIKDLRAVDMIRGKLDDRKMYQHSTDLLEALVRIDPVGAKARLTGLLTHPASAVVAEVEKLLEPRIAAGDLDALRDVFDAGGPAARAASLRLMAKADRVAARADVVKALRDADPEVAFAAASALAADDSPEASELTLKSAVTPVDRQFAYATISLALRVERGGPRVVDDAAARTLLSGRGMKSLDQLCRAAAALLVADEGYFHESPTLDEALDKMVVPLLIDSWYSHDFWPDLKVVQPLVLRRLRRLTGRLDLQTAQDWASWWQQEGSKFEARRVLLDVPPDAAAGMLLVVDGMGAPGGETTVVTADAETLGGRMQDELELLISVDEAKNLAKVVDESGVLRAIEGTGTQRESSNFVGFTVRTGKRERRSSARADSGDAGVDKLIKSVVELRTRYSWQRYRTADNALDAKSFVAAMSSSFAPERSAEERASSLAELIVRSIDDRRGAAWNVRALAELEAMPLLATALGPKETDRLLEILGRRASQDDVAQAIVRVLAKAKRPEATPLVLEFLVTHATSDSRDLLVLTLRYATKEQFLAALADERTDVRLAAFAAAERDTADDAVVAKILKAVDDKDRGVGGEAVRALGRLRIEQARPLIDRLADTPGELRVAAVEALGMLGGSASQSTIMTAYASDDEALRVAAIKAFAASKAPEGLSAVVFAMSGDPSNLVREVAARAILDMGSDRPATELRKLAIDPAQPPGARARALSGYASLRGKSAGEDLAKLLSDPSEQVADEAALGLARWRDPAAVPHLISMLEKGRSVQHARQGLESISVESFAQRDPKMLADLYGGWWELSKDRGPKRWLFDALTLSGVEDPVLRAWADGESGRQVVPSLIAGLRNDKWCVRRACDLALRDLLGKKVGDEDPWTTPGEVARIADAWAKVWAEASGN